MFDYVKQIECDNISRFVENVNNGISQSVKGLSVEHKGFMLGLVEQAVFVCQNIVAIEKITDQLKSMGKKIDFLPNSYQNSMGMVDNFLKYDFISAITKFVNKEIDVLFVTVEALFQKCPSKDDLLEGYSFFEVGGDYSFANISKDLVEKGYEREEFVSHRGQFSIRGDIIEIYPIDGANILRLDFFDNNLEKISEINPENKKLIKNHEKIKIIAINYQKNEKNVLNLTNCIFFDEPSRLEELKKSFEFSDEFYAKNEIFKSTAKSLVAFESLNVKSFFKPQAYLYIETMLTKNYIYQIPTLIEDLKYFINMGKKIYLFCENSKNIQKMQEILKNNAFFIEKNSNFINFVEFSLAHSIYFKNSNCVFLGTFDLFKKEKNIPQKQREKIYNPVVGDYVVHETHGIGKCVGVEKLKFSDYEKDYFVIEYAGGDKFYLPSEQANTLSLFVVGEDCPKLNKLGGTEFAKTKANVYKKVKELAFNLLELYAKREKTKGNVYVKDDYLMEMFEDAFPFEETDDQLRAISEIKKDMEGQKIMDRLVCGDVGFGKTEVALRAIYKAVLSGKQVAFLCPTTILAEQHYKTCIKRFSGFMVKTARFNRLTPLKEQREVLAGLASGEINVVCGTHKLLGKSVEFKNLGLLVLDEEQRFGVEDKERVKTLKNNVDVLTLSATPIPRTLHMALTGIRDISIIETPPKKRLPVQTFVTTFSDTLLTKVCQQELNRGGQVFVVYNRVEDIYLFAKHVQNLMPKAKIGVAHGKLKPKDLEDVILKLYNGEFNILIATTLIENGVDLPIANTLFVVDADNLGLSALYQLRGRIGRSDRLAYAYFTFNEQKSLTENAYKRLNAIVENTQLGSGFKIAMKDLAIRGAGNVLGKEQHGNMMKVGYDLYYKLLDDAIKEIKGEKVEHYKEIRMDINLNAYISETYVEKESERIELYNKISHINSKQTAEQLKTDLEAVYGAVPEQLDNLINIAFLKNLAQKHEVKRIFLSENDAKIFFYDGKIHQIDKNLPIKTKLFEAISYFFEKN